MPVSLITIMVVSPGVTPLKMLAVKNTNCRPDGHPYEQCQQKQSEQILAVIFSVANDYTGN